MIFTFCMQYVSKHEMRVREYSAWLEMQHGLGYRSHPETKMSLV